MLRDLASLPNSRLKSRPVATSFIIDKETLEPNTVVELRPRLEERESCTVYVNAEAGTLKYLRSEEQPSLADIQAFGFPLRFDRAIELSGPNPIWVTADVAMDVHYDDGIG